MCEYNEKDRADKYSVLVAERRRTSYSTVAPMEKGILRFRCEFALRRPHKIINRHPPTPTHKKVVNLESRVVTYVDYKTDDAILLSLSL